jgi:hypothetical protein
MEGGAPLKKKGRSTTPASYRAMWVRNDSFRLVKRLFGLSTEPAAYEALARAPTLGLNQKVACAPAVSPGPTDPPPIGVENQGVVYAAPACAASSNWLARRIGSDSCALAALADAVSADARVAAMSRKL